MYQYKEFTQEMSVEAEESAMNLKIEHTHGITVSMLLDCYNKLTASLKFCCCK